MRKSVIFLTLILTVSITLSADIYTSKAVLITQDGELREGEIVYLVSIDRKGYNFMINRFCTLKVDKYHEFILTWETKGNSETVHVPFNILDIADNKTNAKAAETLSFYRPQVWTVGFEEEETK